jgi:hypothetical protein
MRAMLRPLLRESDFANWQSAAGSNSKWVSLLNEEQLSAFNVLREGSESGTADTISDASSVQPDHQQLLFGVAVIKNAIVVNSTAYLKVSSPIAACFDCAKRSMTLSVTCMSVRVCAGWVPGSQDSSSQRIDFMCLRLHVYAYLEVCWTSSLAT